MPIASTDIAFYSTTAGAAGNARHRQAERTSND